MKRNITGRPKVDRKPHRSWVFTINNSTAEVEQSLKAWPPVLRMAVGRELGEEKKTPHLQGAVSFKDPIRFAALKKLCPTAHWEIMRAFGDPAFTYALKDGDIFIDVDNRKQGKRNDLLKLKERIKEGASVGELWDEFFPQMVRYGANIERSIAQLNPVLTKPEFDLKDFDWPKLELKLPTIIWGETNIGKTCYARAHFKNALEVSHMDDLGGLTKKHDGIIFDDMSFNHMPRSCMLHLTDMDRRSIHCRYKVAVIPKGFPRIFTTNEHNGAIMLTEDPAIKRRIKIVHLIKCFNK